MTDFLKTNYVVWLHNVRTGLFYDITKATKNIVINTNIDGTPGKMTCDIVNKDNLPIEKGSSVSIDYGEWSGNTGIHIYFGFIFHKVFSDKEDYVEHVTCYDQSRYLKNTFTMSTENMTLESVTLQLCTQFHVPLHIKNDTQGHILLPVQFDNDTSMNIIQHCIKDVFIFTGEKFIIRDEFGALFLLNIRSLGKNYHLKYNESIIHYEYETEIDSNTFNVVEAVYGEMNGQTYEIAHKVVFQNKDSQLCYGVLKKTDIVNGYFDNIAQLSQWNDASGVRYLNDTIKINLDCVALPELKAGDVIVITIPVANESDRIANYNIVDGKMVNTYTDGIAEYRGELSMIVMIESCTHKIDAGDHSTTMTVTPLDYDSTLKEYVDYGYGALQDDYEADRLLKEEMRKQLGVIRP